MIGGNGVGMYFWDGISWVGVTPLKSQAPSLVTWTLICDTIVTIPARTNGNAAAIIKVAAADYNDFCTIHAPGGDWLALSSPGYVSVMYWNSSTSGVLPGARLLCVRAMAN